MSEEGDDEMDRLRGLVVALEERLAIAEADADRLAHEAVRSSGCRLCGARAGHRPGCAVRDHYRVRAFRYG